MTPRWLTRIILLSLFLAFVSAAEAKSHTAAHLYKSKCAGCHGADGSKSMMGSKPLSGAEVQGMSDTDLTDAIANGKGKMPAYKGKLTDQQIQGLVSYTRTLKK